VRRVYRRRRGLLAHEKEIMGRKNDFNVERKNGPWANESNCDWIAQSEIILCNRHP
jgi:hypothetical protein